MHIEKNIVLERINKKPILIDTFYSDEIKQKSVIIFCHGYKGFKDWGAWNLMATYFAKPGYCFVKFNFSHNGGTINNPIDFPDLEAFGNNNYTKELDDLNDVMDWVQSHFKNNPNINTNEISLIGHSRGGGIALLKSAEDKRITKLITLASVSDFASRFGSTEEIVKWKNDGVKYVTNGRTKQQMPHYYQFFEDFNANETRLDIASATKKIDIPILIIHGDKDTSVDINEANNIDNWSSNSKLEVITGADHVFNTNHPWTKGELSSELKSVISKIINFIS